MKLQFINNISLDVISGGNIYNTAIIEGLRQKGFEIDYNASPVDKDYDMSIVDSLCMNEIDTNRLKHNSIALIHQLPKLRTDQLNFYRTHTKFIVTGEPTKQELITHWQINENNISIIRPGLHEYWKPKTAYEDQPKRIIIVSNFIQNKGFEMAIQILKRLNHLDLKFDIVGNNKLDKVYAKTIIKSIQHTNANVTFHFNLNQQEVYNQLIESDIFLSLSKSESFGMAIFEALVLGLPCITYKTGDYNYFSSYPNYVGLDDYSENSFSEVLEGWNTNPEHYKSHCNTMSQNKRHWKHVVDEFSMHLTNTITC
nr:glycosyltransferase family 4 protein [uncultured Psychroserpens sp.]